MLKVINPATEEIIAELEEDNAKSIEQKFRRASAAQKAWEKSGATERRSVVTKFKESLLSKKDELAKTLSSEMGKPVAQARREIEATCGRIDFFLENFEKTL